MNVWQKKYERETGLCGLGELCEKQSLLTKFAKHTKSTSLLFPLASSVNDDENEVV
jgi:hypothetical protein